MLVYGIGFNYCTVTNMPNVLLMLQPLLYVYSTYRYLQVKDNRISFLFLSSNLMSAEISQHLYTLDLLQ